MSNAQQALGAIGGAAIGFAIGGPAGALWGFQAGLTVASLVYPTQLPGVQGPRLQDFETLQADPGAPVPIGWGTFPVSGFRMYLGPPEEIATTEEVGGKGGPTQEVTTFTYRQTIALLLCEGEYENFSGPISGVTRIWENGELMYDVREIQDGESTDDYNARLAMSGEYAQTFDLYLGTEDQIPDPTLELEQGVGNVPAYRGYAYIVFPRRLLRSDQGNRHPQWKFEVSKPPLTLLALVPDEIEEGSEGPTVNVFGAGFIPGARVVFNGVEKTTTFLSSTELTFELDDEDIETAGEFDVFVRISESLESNTLPFTVTPPSDVDPLLDLQDHTFEWRSSAAISGTTTVLCRFTFQDESSFGALRISWASNVPLVTTSLDGQNLYISPPPRTVTSTSGSGDHGVSFMDEYKVENVNAPGGSGYTLGDVEFQWEHISGVVPAGANTPAQNTWTNAGSGGFPITYTMSNTGLSGSTGTAQSVIRLRLRRAVDGVLVGEATWTINFRNNT